jgi:hypothetical protein
VEDDAKKSMRVLEQNMLTDIRIGRWKSKKETNNENGPSLNQNMYRTPYSNEMIVM